MALGDILDLALLKDDLGIVDQESDAWLQRRIDAILARFEVYTQRHLAPVKTFTDDWSRIVERGRVWVSPDYPPSMRVSPFLRQSPVVEIMAITQGAAALDVAGVLFDEQSGLLQALTGAPAADLGRELASSLTKITYKAGYATLPLDLYEALVGILRGLLAIRAGGMTGAGALAFKTITVADVGSVQLGGAAGEFEAAALKSIATSDPLLGPWTSLLDSYVDLSASLGTMGRPTSTLVVTP